MIADQIGAQLAVEPFNTGRSFETNHARARFTKGGLSIIVDITEADELFVESDGDAISYAFRKADPFDGGFATIPIDKIRQAYRLHFHEPVELIRVFPASDCRVARSATEQA